ncbi:MAG: hypothetical protein FWG71_06940 [Synergistaceae bacterium]|nr:hypothetical protein [Synergistaceae bacterium]
MRGMSVRSLLIRTALIVCVWGRCASAAHIVAAYQEIYRMNFEVFKQAGLPAGWYVTFDGYPVAQVRPNHWVYGHTAYQGILVPTEVAVGAVVPMDVPQLARVAMSSWRSGAYGTERFRSIAFSGLDNMGVLDDPLAYTPVAWKSGEPGLRIWMGDRWRHIVPRRGQSTSQALMAQHPNIVRLLSGKCASWTMSDTQELADLAREWGFLWRGHISLVYLPGDGYSGSSGRDAAAGGRGGLPGDRPGGGDWDIGRGGGGGGRPGGGGGGGWDR